MPDISEIQRVVAPIAYSNGVKRPYLFGSYAKDKNKNVILV